MKRVCHAVLFGAATLGLGLFSRDAAAQEKCAAPKTTCAGNGGYYASTEDVDRLTAVADPILRDVRTCLDGNGAKHVPSVLVIRWDSDGKPVDVKIDVPGYESLPCVQKAQSKLATLQNPRETAIRCEFGCPRPAAPKPAPAPIVIPPPVTTQPTQVQPAPTQAAPAPAAAPSPPPPRYEKVWYGWETLVADGIAFPLFIGGLAADSGALVASGYVTFVLATPIVHMVHGNIGPGFGSIGIRLFLPLLGFGIGAIAGLIAGGTKGSGDFDRFANGANGAVTGAVVGGFAGAAGCVLIDAAGLAWAKERVDDRPVALGSRSRPPIRTFTLAPTFNVQRDVTSVGVVGQF